MMSMFQAHDIIASNSVMCLIGIPIFEWWVVRCKLKNGHKNIHVFNVDWTTCSKLINCSHLNNHNHIYVPGVGGAYVAFLWLIVNKLK